MNWLQLFSRARRNEDLNRELEAHLELEAEEQEGNGLTPDQARYAARRAFGNTTLTKEETREMWGWVWLEHFLSDVRYALRGFWNNKSMTAVAILSLALGIGANTAIFTLTDAVLLKSLPVPAPGQLYQVSRVEAESSSNNLNYPLFEAMREAVRSQGPLVAVSNPRPLFIAFEGGDGATESVRGSLVSGDYFTVLQVSALAGRTFSSSDDVQPGAHPVAVLSHEYWVRRFQADPAVVGRTFRLRDTTFTVIGVTEKGFRGVRPGNPPDVWMPAAMVREITGLGEQHQNRNSSWLWGLARLNPQTDPAAFEATLQRVYQLFNEQAAAASSDEDYKRRLLAGSVKLESAAGGFNQLRVQFQAPLLLLTVIALFILLIACANVANLLLVRAQDRSREVTVRLALGAGRSRLVRQLLTESVLLSWLGGIAGIALAYVGVRALVSLVTTARQPVELVLAPDWRVLSFTVAVSLFCGVLFGLAPAYSSLRSSLQQKLRARTNALEGGSGFSGKHFLAALQIALSLVLMAGAGLFAVSLNRLYETDAGFHAENVVLVNIDPRASGYNNVSGEERNALHLRLLDELPQQPEIQTVSLSHVGIMQDSWQVGWSLRRPGEIVSSSREDRVFFNDEVSPGFFETAGIALLAGRDFTTRDLPETPSVLILNRTAAEKLFPNGNAVGESVQIYDSDKLHQVVGVVENAKRNNLQDEDGPFLYFPLLQSSSLGWFLIARTAPSETAAAAVQQGLAKIDPNMLISRVTTLERSVEDTLTQQRLLAGLTTCFGGLALFLAAIGLYGLLSFLVRRRTAEIGLRMALGARESQVVGMVAGQASAVVSLGLAAGLVATLLLSPIISSFLYNLEPHDPWTIAGAIAVLAAVAAVSAFLPARRAARLSPSLALRCD